MSLEKKESLSLDPFIGVIYKVSDCIRKEDYTLVCLKATGPENVRCGKNLGNQRQLAVGYRNNSLNFIRGLSMAGFVFPHLLQQQTRLPCSALSISI